MAPPDLSRVDVPSVVAPKVDQDKLTEFVIDSLQEAEVKAQAFFHEKSIPIDWRPDPKLDEGSSFEGTARVQGGKFSIDNPLWIKGLSIWGWLEPFSRIKTEGRPAIISDFCSSYYDLGDSLEESPLGPLYPGGILKPVDLPELWKFLVHLKTAGTGSSEAVEAFTSALNQIHLEAHFFSRPEQIDVCYPSLFSMGIEAYLNFPATFDFLQKGSWSSFGAAIGAGTSVQAENVDLTPWGKFLLKGYQWEKFRINRVEVHFDPIQDDRFAPSRQVRVDLAGIHFSGSIPTSRGIIAVNASGDIHAALDVHGRLRVHLQNLQVNFPGLKLSFRANGSLEGSLAANGQIQLDTAQVTLADLSLGPVQFTLGPSLPVTESLQLQAMNVSIDYDRRRPLENILLEWVGELENTLFLPNAFLLKLDGSTEGNVRLVERGSGLFYRPETFNTSLVAHGELQNGQGLALSTLADAFLAVRGLPPDAITNATGANERNLQISASIGSLKTTFGDFSLKLGSILQVLYADGLGRVGVLPDQFKWLGELGVTGRDVLLDLKDQFLVSNDGEETLWNIGFTQPQRIGPLSVYGAAMISGSFVGVPTVDQVIKNWQIGTNHPLDIVIGQRPIAQAVDLSGGYNLLTGFDVTAQLGLLFDLASGKIEFKQMSDKGGRDFLQTSWDLKLPPIRSKNISLRHGSVRGALELPPNLSDYVDLIQGTKDWGTPVWSNVNIAWVGHHGHGVIGLKPRGRLSWTASEPKLVFRLHPVSALKTVFQVDEDHFSGKAALTGTMTLFEKGDELRFKLHELGIAAGEVFLEGEDKILLANHAEAFLENPVGWPWDELPAWKRHLLNLSPGRVKFEGDFNIPALSRLLMPERPLEIDGTEFTYFGKVSKKIALDENGLVQLLREVLARQRWDDRRQGRERQEGARQRLEHPGSQRKGPR